MKRSAEISACGRYRWVLTRIWDERPVLVAVMFNPSTADGRYDDPTITTLMHRASRWGYGGIVVVNLIPLRSSMPDAAVDMVSTFDQRAAWDERDALQLNLSVLEREIGQAGAILLAYGALGARVSYWTDHVLEEIERFADRDARAVPIFVMGRTLSGHPIHPLARGKYRVPNDAPLLPWKPA